MENLIDDDLEKSSSGESDKKLIMILIIKWNMTMIMMNPMNNLLKVF